MKTFKKMLALVLAFAMLFTLVTQLPAYAELAEGGLASGDTKATFKVVTLEKDGGYSDTSKNQIGSYGFHVVENIDKYLSSKSSGEQFFIGVQVTGIKNVKPANSELGSLGINTIQFGLKFNTDYIEFDGKLGGNGNYNYNSVQNAIKKLIQANDGEYAGDYLYKESENGLTYDLGGSSGTNVVTHSSANDGIVFTMIWRDDEESPTYLPNDGDFIVVLPFKMVQDGSGIPDSGTSIFSFSPDRSQYTLSFGNSTDQNYYAYEVPAGKSGINYEPDPINHKDILNVVNFDATGVDYFPQTYYVDFYKTESEGSAAQTLSTAKSNNPYVDQSDIDNVTTQLSPDSDGKYLKRWYYKTTEQQDGSGPTEVKKDFTGNTYAGEDKSSVSAYGTNVAGLVANDPGQGDTMRAKVYGEWEQGESITFHSNYPDGSDKQGQDSDVTLYADPTTHKIAESELSKLESMKTPPTGYVLAGWAKDNKKDSADITDGDLATTNFDSVTDVYAVWTERITISFYDNYQHGENEGKGALKGSVTLNPGESVQGSYPGEPERPNYTFNSWNTKQNGTGESISSADISSHTFNESTELFAIWDASGGDTVTLTFNPVIEAARNTVKPASITVNRNDTVYEEQITDTPTVDNYTFAGWFKDPAANTKDEVKFDSGYTVTDDEDLYAHWKHSGDNPVVVTFMAEGATGVGGDNKYTEVTVEKGDSLGDMMPTNPTKSGSQFTEWNENEGGGGTTFGKDTSVSDSKTVYAQWVDEITVEYNLNGGSAAPPIDNASGLPGATFTLTDTEPTNEPYEFIGWNTKQNGAGDYIEDKNGGADWTFKDLADKAGDAFQDGKVTLYAQWGYVSPPEAGGDAVRVTFDSNANGGASTEANPTYKDVAFDHSIGEGNMPDPPTRDGYTFASWNTKQNGTGDTVDASYTFTKEKNDPDGDAKTTVYAQWTVDIEGGGSEITISFDTNGGDAAANPPSMTINEGDALSALPDEPTRDGYKFVKWAKGKTDADTEVKVGDPVFTTSETVYAVWTRQLRFDIGYERSDGYWNGYNQTVYNGTNQAPTHVKIYNVTNVENKEQDGTDITDTFSSYTLKYYLTTQTAVDATADAPKNAGEYRVEVEFTDNTNGETKLYQTNPGSLKVEPQGVTVKVTESTQDVKVSSSSENAAAPTIDVTDENGPFSSSKYEIKYYKWTPSDKSDSTIDAVEVASSDTAASALTVGWYVVKVTITDSNYEIGTVTGKVYDGAGGLPNYAGAAKGENIVFHVILNDPKANSLEVTKPGGEELELKDENYTTPKPFKPEEKTDTDYYVRADKDTDEVDIKVEAEPDYDVKVEFNGHVVEKDPSDNKYHIEGLEGAKEGSSNDVTVTVKPKDADSPTQTYTVHVQRLVEAKIEFKPGNSPYGLIERMSQANGGSWDAGTVAAAKADFDDNFTFNTYFPDHLISQNVKYWSYAWSETDDGEDITGDDNMDTNPYAIMLYQGDKFVDPGFTAYDSEGKKIESPDYTATMSVKKMTGPSYVNMPNNLTSDVTIKNKDTDSPDYTFDTYNAGAQYIYFRPGVYDLVYTITDPVTSDTITNTRKVVMLYPFGDADMSTAIAQSDANIMSQSILGKVSPLNNVSGNMTLGIYIYRIQDADNSGAFAISDANMLSQSVLGKYTIATFYPTIESLETE